MRIDNINWQVTDVFDKNMEALYAVKEDGRQKYRYIINSGSSRSSKSYSIMQILMIQALQRPTNIVVAMNTLAQIKDTIIKTILPVLLMDLQGFGLKYNKSEHILYFSNGSTISFNGADDEERVKGIESDILWCDEANNMSADVLSQLFMRNKGTIFLSFNPSGDLTFIDQYLNKQSSIHIHSTWRKNPFVTEEQAKTILSMKHTDENEYRIYGLGLRGVPKEAVYRHFKELKQMPPNIFTNYIYGMDFSFHRNPLMRIWYNPLHNKIYIEEVFFGEEVTTTDVLALLNEHSIDYETPIIADSASPQTLKDIKKKGYNIIPINKKKYTLQDAISYIKTLDVYYKPSKRLETELSNYKYKKIGKIITDNPIPKYDDELDAIRYVTMYLREHKLHNQPKKQKRVKFFKST